jgi:hypothetical protein
MAALQTFSAISLAKSLAMAASLRQGGQRRRGRSVQSYGGRPEWLVGQVEKNGGFLTANRNFEARARIKKIAHHNRWSKSAYTSSRVLMANMVTRRSRSSTC